MTRRLLPVVIAAVLLSACSRPAAVSRLGVDMYEWGLDTTASAVQAAEVTVEMANTGQVAHTLVVTAADGRVVAASPILRPGEEGEITIDLSPGVYEFTCRIVVELETGLVDHYENGMRTEVTSR